MHYIVKDTVGKEGHWGGFPTLQDAEAQAERLNFKTVIVQSDLDPELLIFERQPDGKVLAWERALTREEIKAKQDWKGLEDDLEFVELIDSFPETFFERALSVIATSQGAGMYALLMNCFGANQWDKRLKPALQAVKDMLPTPLTNAELEQLNDILATRGFSIVIT